MPVQFVQVVFDAFDVAQAVFHVRYHIVQWFANSAKVKKSGIQ